MKLHQKALLANILFLTCFTRMALGESPSILEQKFMSVESNSSYALEAMPDESPMSASELEMILQTFENGNEAEECHIEIVLGIVKKCCQKRGNPATRNCTDFALDFVTQCKEKKLECQFIEINCTTGLGHAVVAVNLGPPLGWVLIDPHSGNMVPIPGGLLNIPNDALCKMMGSPPNCRCDYDITGDGFSNTDPMYCRNVRPRLDDCNACCRTRAVSCREQALPADRPDCDEQEKICTKNCEGLKNDIEPSTCADEAKNKRQSLEQCSACCAVHPMATSINPRANAEKWVLACIVACTKAELPSGPPYDICKNENPNKRNECRHCCGLKGSSPNCMPTISPACMGWIDVCKAKCDTIPVPPVPPGNNNKICCKGKPIGGEPNFYIPTSGKCPDGVVQAEMADCEKSGTLTCCTNLAGGSYWGKCKQEEVVDEKLCPQNEKVCCKLADGSYGYITADKCKVKLNAFMFCGERPKRRRFY